MSNDKEMIVTRNPTPAVVVRHSSNVTFRVLVVLAAAIALLSSLGLIAARPRPAQANGVGTIFVANEAGNSVSVIEHIGNAVLATINVGGAPQAIAFTGDGRFALIANRGSSTLSQIDRDLYEVTATVRVEGTLVDIAAPAGTTLTAVADATNNRLIVVDSAGATVRTIPLPGRPIAQAADRSGRSPGRVYVSVPENVVVVNVVTGEFLGTIAVGGQPGDLSLNPAGSQLFVSLPAAGQIAIVDTAESRALGTIFTGPSPAGSAVSRDGSHLYVANAGANTVSVIEVSPRRVVHTIEVGANPRDVALSPDGGPFAYVANAGANTVSVIDLARNMVVKTVPVGSRPVAINVAAVPPGPGFFLTAGASMSADPAGALGQSSATSAADGRDGEPVADSQPLSRTASTGGTNQGGPSIVPIELPQTGQAVLPANSGHATLVIALLLTIATACLFAAATLMWSVRKPVDAPSRR
jgi:YVTN family beta-propeller protein